MADLLPSTPDLGDARPDDPRVVGVDTEDAESVISTLSSETARRILAELHADPAPASEIADRADTTLQNAQYHLGRLSEAGLVEVAGTAYSEKGREMDVYAPADRALVVVAGREEDAAGLESALRGLLGAIVPLAIVSVALEFLLDGPFVPASGGGAYAAQSADVTTGASSGLAGQLATSPGVLAFVGGLLALGFAVALVRYRG
jgi:DNA-binding transcriptional ArsR family regulator